MKPGTRANITTLADWMKSHVDVTADLMEAILAWRDGANPKKSKNL